MTLILTYSFLQKTTITIKKKKARCPYLYYVQVTFEISKLLPKSTSCISKFDHGALHKPNPSGLFGL